MNFRRRSQIENVWFIQKKRQIFTEIKIIISCLKLKNTANLPNISKIWWNGHASIVLHCIIIRSNKNYLHIEYYFRLIDNSIIYLLISIDNHQQKYQFYNRIRSWERTEKREHKIKIISNISSHYLLVWIQKWDTQRPKITTSKHQ